MIWECTLITFFSAIVAGGMGFFAGMGYQRAKNFEEVCELKKEVDRLERLEQERRGNSVPLANEIKYGGF